MKKTYTFHVHGMHCQACVALTESELSDTPGVLRAKSNLATKSVEVTGDFNNEDPNVVAQDLTKVLKPHGYSLSLEEENSKTNWKEFSLAIPIALGFVGLFLVLQKLGLVNIITASKLNYAGAFMVGVVASVSTCMAVVGGLVLSMSASFAKGGDKVLPQMLFHLGRLVSFFILGGVIGAFGAAFQLGVLATSLLNVVVALVLLLLGINLLDIFHWSKKFQPTMPRFIGKRAHDLKKTNHIFTPLLVGVATFFLPCGFTQSMQIYTLTTGNFVTGALLMSFFALGTLPVLAMLSFSSAGISKKGQSGVFFKTAGLVVIFFGIFNIINALIGAGIIPPIFNL